MQGHAAEGSLHRGLAASGDDGLVLCTATTKGTPVVGTTVGLAVMGQSHAPMREQLERADNDVDRTRQAQAREAAQAGEGG